MKLEAWVIMLVCFLWCVSSTVAAYKTASDLAFAVGLTGTILWSMIVGWITITSINDATKKRRRLLKAKASA